MNILVRTSELELQVEDIKQEEGLDVLALLINTGVIPSDEEFFLDEEEDCEECCGCQCEEEETHSVESAVSEILNIISEAIKEIEEEEQQEEQPQITPLEVQQLIQNIFGVQPTR